jgi:hypothetical protein
VTGPSRDLARARILLVGVCLIGVAAFIVFAVLAPADWWVYALLAAGWAALAEWAAGGFRKFAHSPRSPLPERIKA